MLLKLTTVSLPFSLVAISVLSSKWLHLSIHLADLSPQACAFYLPTVVVSDIAVILLARLLLRRDRGRPTWWGFVVVCIGAITSLSGAASEWGFFHETDGELPWVKAGLFVNSGEGLKVLLSGSTAVPTSALAILALSWLVRDDLYNGVGNAISGLTTLILTVYRRCHRSQQDKDQGRLEVGHGHVTPPMVPPPGQLETRRFQLGRCEGRSNISPSPKPSYGVPAWVLALLTVTWLVVAAAIRPAKPYRHLSTTLPFRLLDAFRAVPDLCTERERLAHNPWPLPDLIAEAFWLRLEGDFKGWAPGHTNRWMAQYEKRTPDWLPTPVPRGFARWDPSRFEGNPLASPSGAAPAIPATSSLRDGITTEAQDKTCEDSHPKKDSFYNPVNDPLKIYNLDAELLGPIRDAVENGSVRIKHVVFILMESIREDLFPLQQGTEIHRVILESHDEEARNEIDRVAASMTPNSEKITGKEGGFHARNGTPDAATETEWNDRTETRYGGINIVGALSPSSVSTKSAAASHCGVWPMPVDMFEEAETESYQPCLPQILSLFNHVQRSRALGSGDYREWPWRSGFFQAVTEMYDRQHVFNQKMGFDHRVTSARIKQDNRDHPDVQELNYFGYADTQLKSYISDFIRNSTARHERMFLSHFTSTTHHPWATPDWFNTTTYMGPEPDKELHSDMNRYLNTIRFHDAWLGELMQLFDDHGIANETLVVLAGDHGQAFREDTDVTGTYGNGHISNFRIPITFRHPRLPRYQHEASATSVSVLPTILDLLISTGSLHTEHERIASDLLHEYEGQSLIRPYLRRQNGRRAWNFGLVNAGGGIITVKSADAPWRLIMPLEHDRAYSLADLSKDPLELAPVMDWSFDGLVRAGSAAFGADAAQWATEAEAVTRWFSLERRQLWHYGSTKLADA